MKRLTETEFSDALKQDQMMIEIAFGRTDLPTGWVLISTIRHEIIMMGMSEAYITPIHTKIEKVARIEIQPNTYDYDNKPIEKVVLTLNNGEEWAYLDGSFTREDVSLREVGRREFSNLLTANDEHHFGVSQLEDRKFAINFISSQGTELRYIGVGDRLTIDGDQVIITTDDDYTILSLNGEIKRG